jgi:DNA mismatch endonuclease (patch repair protein)
VPAMDTVGKRERSRIMAAVRSKNTRSTEWKLRAILISAGIRQWRYQLPGMPGKPDFVFPVEKLAIFVDGCFWHGCPKCYRRPSSRRSYWDAKVAHNILRDRRNRSRLRRECWRVVRIWEHQLVTSPANCVKRIQRKLSDEPHRTTKEIRLHR